MSLSEKRNAIKAWFSAATGLKTIWSDQGTPRSTYPYATLRPLSDSDVGCDWIWELNESNPGGEELDLHIREDGLLTVSCQTFAKPGPHDQSAEHYMLLARRALNRPSVQLALRNAGLSVAEKMPIHDLSGTADKCALQRAAMDVQFNFAHRETPTDERQTHIEHVTGTLVGEGLDVNTGS